MSLTLSSTIPYRFNYEFIGQSTSSSATTATYTAGGSYTGGSVSTDSQMLSRRAQIDRLGAEVTSLEKDSAETEKDIAENEKAIKAVTEQEKTALGASAMIKTLRDAESTQKQILVSNREVL